MLVPVPQRPPRAGRGFIDLICGRLSLPPPELHDYKRQSEVGGSVVLSPGSVMFSTLIS